MVGLSAAAVLAILTATGGAQGTAQKTLTLDGGQGRSKRIDNPPRGRNPSVGDVYVFDTPLFQNGRRVGQDRGVCTVLTATKFRASCNDTLELTGGNFYTQGVFTDEDANGGGIVGGNGAFLGAQGSIVITTTGRTEKLILKYR
jgi:hypothetical protein